MPVCRTVLWNHVYFLFVFFPYSSYHFHNIYSRQKVVFEVGSISVAPGSMLFITTKIIYAACLIHVGMFLIGRNKQCKPYASSRTFQGVSQDPFMNSGW